MNPSLSDRRRSLGWLLPLALPFALWMGLALALRLPGPLALRLALAVVVPGAGLAALALWPGWRGRGAFLVAFLAVLTFFLALRPRNDRNWWPDVAHVPTVDLHGPLATVHNVRNCIYQDEQSFVTVFQDRQYDLRNLQGLDLFLVSWGPRHIAHTILSFDFGAGQHLAFSIETRKERGESYSALRGFFREYELCIVAGDERDLIRLRTNFRKEQVRLYRLNTTSDVVRAIFVDYAARANVLARQPEWYNALTDNCTTAMIGPVRRRSGRVPLSWKLIASGHVDELIYDQGIIDRKGTFEETRAAALINAKAMAAHQDPAFSRRIRE